ncbi:hypothetical protein [Nocardioides sp.]|uniref:hypothetical protein n=1 Tax=Nocardioides sp. TaxID=35761 RepID=UPI0026344BDD|nr:hypothetical protein [Nocardioides sp.]MDI6911929.1 hypothetical protein [Nocardioides sp.]
MILLHMGALHPVEKALTLVLAFGPFLLLGLVVWLRGRAERREDAPAESISAENISAESTSAESTSAESTGAESAPIESSPTESGQVDR